jgi:two-component system nitrogen regulation sensor histidine kinase NtrY
VLTGLRLSDPTLWSRLRGPGLERRLALVLVVLAVVSGIATYVVISGTPFGSDIRLILFLLNLDLIILLLLGVVIARRLVELWAMRRRGSAGSGLHVRLVALFSLVAVVPAILVALFSLWFLHSGLNAWFGERVKNALDTSLAVAQAYLEEHKANIRADALAMAADLNREGPLLLTRSDQLQDLVEAQAALRNLTEAIVFDGGGEVIAQTGLSFSLGLDTLDPATLERAAAGEVLTLTSETEDRVRALLRLDGFGDAYLYVGRLVDPDVLAYLARARESVGQYELIESERSRIQITAILIFAIVAMLLLFAAVWMGLQFATSLAEPLAQLIAASNRVSAGDLMARVAESGGDGEIDSLARAFNRMTSQLSSQRRELIEANQQLDERRRFTDSVLTGVTAGVIGLDEQFRIVLPNRSACAFLEADAEDLRGRRLADVMPELAPVLARFAAPPWELVDQHLQVDRQGRIRTLLVRIAPQLDRERLTGLVVTFDEISELLSAQRVAAWAEIARRIAHEIKNPLTPIRLSAERLERKYLSQIREDPESFTGCTQTIVRQVDSIGRLINEFSAFARMPEPVFTHEDMSELVREAVTLQRSARPGVTFTVQGPPGPVPLTCDGNKVGQVLTNLLQNALDAIEARYGSESSDGRITVQIVDEPQQVRVTIEDNGVGLPKEERARLFEPYVTTRARGTGLGLAIVKKIMEEHAGTVALEAGPAGGAVARLCFPKRPPVSPQG